MRLEVDLSGVLGKTSTPTVVAFSNTESSSILISGKDKREILSALRLVKGITIRTYLRLFATLIFLSVKYSVKESDTIVIDEEFSGKEGEIRAFLLALLRRGIPKFPKENIQFSRIGKGSPAHKLASSVFQGKQKPTKTVTVSEILKFFKIK